MLQRSGLHRAEGHLSVSRPLLRRLALPVMDDVLTDQLLRRVARGDQAALQRLLVQLHDHLRMVVTRHLDAAARRRFDPDDMLQDAYISVFRSAAEARFQTAAQFTRWVEAVVINTTLSRVRDQHRRKRDVARETRPERAAGSSYLTLVEQLSAGLPTPSRQVARDEATAAVLSSLARLTEEQRSVIRLRFFDGLPVAKVARDLGKQENAVHALTYRALRALREHLGSISSYLSRS